MSGNDEDPTRFVALATLAGILFLGVIYLWLGGYALHHHY